MPPRSHLVLLAVALVVAGACTIEPAAPPSSGPTAAPSALPSHVPAPAAASPIGPDRDGTMTEEEFQNDLQDAATTIQRYWQAQFDASGIEFTPIRRFVPYEQSGEVTCGGEPVPANNALYCPDGDFIAYDLDWAVVAFRKIGDAFLYYLLGHEYAHGIQVRLGESFSFTVEQELQADCMAGAYIGDTVRAGGLTLADGDLDELRTGLAAVGDDPDQPWFAPGAHGSAEQRTRSFFDGYQNSLSACDL